MNTIHAIYEQGDLRPTQPVDLPEHAQVAFEPRVVGADVSPQIQALRDDDPGLAAVYDVLSHRHSSGQADVAERHNEHQP